jgi:ABC-2 type transport system ATP-binding protein
MEQVVKRFPPQLDWHQLIHRQPDKLVIDRVSFEVNEGEIFCLIGPNGAGKTTLIKILCGLILPTSGEARVAGFDVVKEEQEVRRRTGLVYGDARSFFWRLTLRENLRFYAALYRMSAGQVERRIADLAKLVSLTNALDVRMHFFSSGMKQRAAIARGLLTDPPVVFLDEPTATVDPVAAHEIRTMIRDRVLDGTRTIFLTTNIMSEAEELSDRVALIREGRIEMTGPVDILRERFQPYESYRLVVEGASIGTILQLQAVPGARQVTYAVTDRGGYEVTLEIARGGRAVPDALALLISLGASVWECTPQRMSLDDMFRLVFAGASSEAAPSDEDLVRTA